MGRTKTRIREGSRNYFTQIPNMILDMGLSVYAIRLYLQLKRVAGEEGKCWQSAETLAAATCMSKGRISKSKKELTEAGLIIITITANNRGGMPYHEITITDIWKKNMAHFSGPVDAGGTRSPDDLARSPDDLARSPDDLARSPDDLARSRGVLKEEPIKKNPIRITHEEDIQSSSNELIANNHSQIFSPTIQWANDLWLTVTGGVLPVGETERTNILDTLVAIRAARKIESDQSLVEYLRPFEQAYAKRYRRGDIRWLSTAASGQPVQPQSHSQGRPNQSRPMTLLEQLSAAKRSEHAE